MNVPIFACTLIALAAGGALAGSATAPAPPNATVGVAFPGDEGMDFKAGAGAGIARGQCLTCHSSAYVSMQPRLSRAQWSAEVAKMVKAYGAPVPDDQVPVIVDYLTAEYGKP